MDGDAEETKNTRRRKWRLSVAVALTVYSIFVAVCLAAVVFYVFHLVQPEPEREIYIKFDRIGDLLGDDEPVKFSGKYNNNVSWNSETSQITINCKGSYILHMDVCYEALDKQAGSGNGTLELRVKGRVLAMASFPLHTTMKACEGLQQMIYLRPREEATLHFYSNRNLKVNTLTVGLNYLLGRVCYR